MPTFSGRLAVAVALVAVVFGAANLMAAGPEGRYLVLYQGPGQVDRGLVEAHGHKIAQDLGDAGVLVVQSTNPADLAALPGVEAVATDSPRIAVPPNEKAEPLAVPAAPSSGCASTGGSCDLQWDLARIHVPQAWQVTQGSSRVKVAVLDTGLRSTHEEVGPNYDIAESRSFVQPTQFCADDATTFSSIEDFNGHGTWTGLHIAGKNGAFMTGIAPRTTLVNVRVLGACGFGFDSWILNGMLYANQVGARVISMSLGGYLCASGVVPGSFYCGTAADVGTDPATWQVYVRVIDYLRQHGTVVIAATGNEHVRLDERGRVISAGTLAFNSLGPDPANDLRGLSELPAGVPGSVAVAALNRVTAEGTAGQTAFGQYGVGRRDQLTYYSSYGERVDVSAPGGARNFNIPNFDCLVGACGRLGNTTVNPADNPGDFGAWGSCDNCYVFIQGTSMATPQVAGVAALALAAHPRLDSDALVGLLRDAVTDFRNPDATPPIAGNPASPLYNFDVNYGGRPIDNDLMGSGVIDAAKSVR